jgi:hypothetical protein
MDPMLSVAVLITSMQNTKSKEPLFCMDIGYSVIQLKEMNSKTFMKVMKYAGIEGTRDSVAILFWSSIGIARDKVTHCTPHFIMLSPCRCCHGRQQGNQKREQEEKMCRSKKRK